jgi:tetratricopeptide (TPR) repeat protein
MKTIKKDLHKTISLVLLFSIALQSCNTELDANNAKLSHRKVLPLRNMSEDVNVVQHIANYIESGEDLEFTTNIKRVIDEVRIDLSRERITSSANAIGLLVAAKHRFSEEEKQSMSQSQNILAVSRLTIEQWRKAKADLVINDQLSWQKQPENFINKSYDFVEAQMGLLRKFVSDIEGQKLQQDPNRFQVPSRNENFVGREIELEKIKNHLQENKTVCITGSGGLGKSQLAAEYLSRSNYEKILWLYAEHGLMFSQIQTYMQQVYGIEPGALKQEELLSSFYNRLGQKACIVIDNAEDADQVLPFFPKNQQVDIIITSRYKSWEFPMVDLSAFSKNDTYRYIVKAIGDGREILEKDSDQLHKLVDGLPLAVVQAAAYIKQRGDISLPGYCEIFSKNSEGTLRDGDPAIATVSTTLTLALHDIRKKDNYVDDLLNICSYISPDHITMELLQNFFLANKSADKSSSEFIDMDKTIKILMRYSILSFSDNFLKIHRLTQAVMRMIHRKNHAFDKNFEIVSKWLVSQLDYNNREKDTSYFFNLEGYYNYSENQKERSRAYAFTPHALFMCEIEDVMEKYYWRHLGVMYLLIGEVSLNNSHYSDEGKIIFCLEKALKIFEENLKPDDLILAHNFELLGHAYHSDNSIEKMKEFYKRALVIREENYGLDSPLLLNNLNLLIQLYFFSLESPLWEAREEFEASFRALQEEGFELESFFLNHLVRNFLTSRITGQKRLDESFKYVVNAELNYKFLERALKITEKHLGANHPDTAEYFTKAGDIYRNLGKFEESKKSFEHALRIKESFYGPDDEHIVNDLINLGHVNGRLKNFERKKELFERALKIKGRYYDHDEHVVKDLMNLGHVNDYLKNFEKRMAMEEDLDEIAGERLGFIYEEQRWNSIIVNIFENLSHAYGSLKFFKKKKEFCECALMIREKYLHSGRGMFYQFGNNQYTLRQTNNYYKVCKGYESLGNFEKMRELLERALSELEQVINTEDQEIWVNVQKDLTFLDKQLDSKMLARAYGYLGNFEKQKDLLEGALKLFNEFPFFENKDDITTTTGAFLENLGNTYGNLGDFEKQRDLLELALIPYAKSYGRIEKGDLIQFYVPNNTRIGDLLVNINNAYDSLGDFEKKKDLLERALIINRPLRKLFMIAPYYKSQQ